MGKKLYVGNISFNTTENAIFDMFSQVGAVETVRLISDRDTGRSKGFGFVEMGTDEEAEKAIGELNGKEVDGRQLTVNEAREPQRRDFGGGGGGRSGRDGGRGGFGGSGGRGGGRY